MGKHRQETLQHEAGDSPTALSLNHRRSRLQHQDAIKHRASVQSLTGTWHTNGANETVRPVPCLVWERLELPFGLGMPGAPHIPRPTTQLTEQLCELSLAGPVSES